MSSKKCGEKPAKKEKKYECSKCGSTSDKEKNLCKPKPKK